jgi:hypothetical protein
MIASSALPACSGGGATSDTSRELTPSTQRDDAPPSPITGGTIENARFTLSSATAQQTAPFCLGYVFRRGDVPAGCSVASDSGTLQVSVKNTWLDGSVKFALLAGQADVPAGAGRTVNLHVVAATSPSTVLGTEHLRRTGVVAEVGCGTFGTARWQDADWDAPFQTWISGPVMSSWIYRKPVGIDPHLVAWLEVRLWANGAVEVLPWVENGYLKVAGPTNKAANYSFSLGGSLRMSAAIDLKHHQRTPLVSGTALSYWLATDPAVTPKHDKAYLMATELVPTYLGKLARGAARLNAITASYAPLQAGGFVYDGDSMASSGYQYPIGLLPEHDVLYLVSDADAAYGGVVRNGFSAGRYGIHYRDETTNRPLRFSAYPNLVIGDSQGFKDTGGSTTNQRTPPITGGNPPGWDVAHSPSVGFMAYLLTGRWYFMEEVQFAATCNYLGNGDNAALREGVKGIQKPAVGAWQTRSCAWAIRTLAQALCVTPDDDTNLRNEFIASAQHNIDHFHGTYVAQPNNGFGIIQPGETYDNGTQNLAIWQQDFATAAFGYFVSLAPAVSSPHLTKLAAFFQWKARSIVMRLGTSSNYWYVNCAAFYNSVKVGTTSVPDYVGGTGPWYTTEAQVYAATIASGPDGDPSGFTSNTEGVIGSQYAIATEPTLLENLLPAIAYAVRHKVPNAQAGYARLTAATNWPDMVKRYNTKPLWGIGPAATTSDMPSEPT